MEKLIIVINNYGKKIQKFKSCTFFPACQKTTKKNQEKNEKILTRIHKCSYFICAFLLHHNFPTKIFIPPRRKEVLKD